MPGDITFEREWEPVKKSGISNPAAPSQSSEQPTTPEKGHISDASTSAPSTPKPAAKMCCNSLSSLSQYNKNVYDQGKCHAAAEGAHIVEGKGLEAGGVEWEPNMSVTDWFHEAVHTALAAVSDDQLQAEDAINGTESMEWKAGMEEELAQIEKLAT